MDGQLPIIGAHVYLFAANTAGYEADSVPLLVAAGTGYADSLGGYTLTGQDGSFSIPGGYTCKSNDQLYIYVLGGNVGLGSNTAIGELAVVGACPLSVQNTPSFVLVNEVSTVAAAYAIAGFATDATHVSSSGTSLAQTDVANAFGSAANLASPSTGAALSVIPSVNATVPQSEINTLANILAACIHSASSNSSGCTNLLSNAQTGSTTPTDTATAMLNIAHSPSANVAALYTLQSTTFSPALTSAPNDFSVAINFATIDSEGSSDIAIDGAGNVWLDNGLYSVIVLSNLGDLVSGANGYGDGLYGPGNLAIDQNGDAWIGNYETIVPNQSNAYSIFEFSNSGTLLSGGNGYAGGGLNAERGVAIDGTGNAWAVNTNNNSISKFSNSGVALSGNSGFKGGGMSYPVNIRIDGSGNAWVTNATGNGITQLSNAGAVLSGTGFTDGGAGNPFGIAIDASGDVWVTYPDSANNGLNGSGPFYNRVVKYSNSGSVLSGTKGFDENSTANGFNIAIDGGGNAWTTNYYGHSVVELSNSGAVLSGANGYSSANVIFPSSLAIDGSGNVWVTSGDIQGKCNVVEYIGIAVPVITPISAGLPATPTADGSSKLGTKP
jgi:hypothetical protein